MEIRRNFCEGSRSASLSGLFATLIRVAERFRRWQRTCLLVLLIVLFLCVALCAVATFLAGRASAQETEPMPLDVLLLIDHSNSMWEKGGVGSDPHLLRLEAAGLFISYLGLDADRADHRLGVIYFGGESRLVVPLTSISNAAQRTAIREAIAHPTPMDWTDPLRALEMAYEELFHSSRHDPDHRPAVVLLTDGKPELASVSTPEKKAAYVADLRDLVERFRERGCPIFTIALASEATDADPEIQTFYRNLWQEIAARTPPGEYYEARTARDLPHIYHSIVAHLLGVEAHPPVVEVEVEGTLTEEIPVEAGLARLVLLVFKSDASIRVRLLRPGGASARPDDPDVRYVGGTGNAREEVWAISNPRPGLWKVELSGHGVVLVWKDTIPVPDTSPPAYTILVEAPPPYVPADQPLEIICAVQNGEGTPLQDSSLQVVVELRRAGFAEAALMARDDGHDGDAAPGDGYYTARHPALPPGAYTFLVRALQQGREIARREVAFEAVPLPRMEVLSPSPGLSIRPGETVTIALNVLASLYPLDGAALQAIGTLTPVVCGPDGVTYPLNLSGGPAGRFEGRFSAPTVEGAYTLTLHLQGETAEGLPFDETQALPFTVTSPPRTYAGWAWLAIGVLTTGGVLGGAMALLARRRRPVLEGRWRVLVAPPGQRAGQIIDLPGDRARVTLGGRGEGCLPLPGDPALEVSVASLQAGRGVEGEVEIWLAPLEAASSAHLTVNRRPLSGAYWLQDGDVVALGDYRLRYENVRQAAARLARRRPRKRAAAPP